MKFNKKKFWLILIAAVIAAGALLNALRPKNPVYKTEIARRGDIAQEVSETGSVQKGEVLNLNFKNSGQVDRVFAGEGDEVLAGQILAELDAGSLKIQLAQAQANLELYSLQLEKLKTGAAAEDIEIAQSQAQSAQTALANAEQSLADARINAGQKSVSAYKTAVDYLSAAYVKAYNAYNFSDLLQRTYFAPRDPDSIAVWETLQKMNLTVAKIKNYEQTGQANGKNNSLDPVFSGAKAGLAEIESQLRNIRIICEKLPWRDTVSQSDKDSLDLHIGYVVAAQASFNSAVENVALQAAANDSAVNAAQAAVDAAKAALATSGRQLEKTTAEPRREDVAILEAQIAQASAQVELLKLQIKDSQLTAPANGQIAKINIKAGENVSLSNAGAAILLLPADPYQIKADIYEEDAAKIKIGNPATIEIAAISEEKFSGKVSQIAPAGKLVNGVVYYETKINFDQIPAQIKPDMTADIVITAASKSDAVLVSETALQKKPGGGYFVQILENGQPKNTDVGIGIRSKGVVEIVSGLLAGAKVIIP